MLTIGDKFPSFDLKAVVSTDRQDRLQADQRQDRRGQVEVVFFWPKDFTFVCPTEIAAFGKLDKEFEERDAVATACRPTASSCISPGASTTTT